jgi:hypothetical protein
MGIIFDAENKTFLDLEDFISNFIEIIQDLYSDTVQLDSHEEEPESEFAFPTFSLTCSHHQCIFKINFNKDENQDGSFTMRPNFNSCCLDHNHNLE